MVESLDGLEVPIAKLYAKGDDGKFRLGVEGVEPEENVRGLKTKVETLLAEKKTAQEREEAARLKLEEENAEKLKRSGDTDAIEKSYKKKLEELKKERDDAVSSRERELDALIRTSQVSAMLEGKVKPTAKKWIERDIIERTRLESVDGKRLVRVLDSDGKPTAQSLEEYIKSNVLDNSDYAEYVIGSRSAGGGANGNPSKARGDGKSWKDMSGSERTELYRKNPQEYERLRGH